MARLILTINSEDYNVKRGAQSCFSCLLRAAHIGDCGMAFSKLFGVSCADFHASMIEGRLHKVDVN